MWFLASQALGIQDVPPALFIAVADGLQGPTAAEMCRVHVGILLELLAAAQNKKRPVGSDIAGNLWDVWCSRDAASLNFCEQSCTR